MACEKIGTVRYLCVLIVGVAMTQAVLGAEPKSVHVFTEQADESNSKCGLSESMIVSAASYPIQQSSFALMPESQSDAADFFAYINVNLMYLSNDHCAGSVRVTFYTYGLALLPWNEKPATEWISLCEKGGIAIYRRDKASDEFIGMIERATKDCIVKLRTPTS